MVIGKAWEDTVFYYYHVRKYLNLRCSFHYFGIVFVVEISQNHCGEIVF